MPVAVLINAPNREAMWLLLMAFVWAGGLAAVGTALVSRMRVRVRERREDREAETQQAWLKSHARGLR